MIDVICYYCGSDQRRPYAAENGFTLVKCSGCGLLYVTPRPNNQEIAKAHQYGTHKGESALCTTGSFSPAKVVSYVKILNDLYGTDLASRTRTWLDIGCGHGELLVALKKISGGHIVARGVEPNVHKRESARKKDLDVDYFNIDAHETKYDFVSLLNVYSHLPNPPEFLRSCHKLLNRRGEILIETGDAAHLSAAELYRPMCLPDHLSIASEEIVNKILCDCGFDIVTVCKFPLFPHTLIGIAKELAKVFLPHRTSRLKYLMNSKYRTDMYIRAKAVSLDDSPID